MTKRIKINHFPISLTTSDVELIFWKVYRNIYLNKLIWSHTRIFNNVYYLTKYLYFEQDSLIYYPYWSYMTVITLVGEFSYSLSEILPPFITRLTLRDYSNENEDQSIPETINNLTIMDQLPKKNSKFKIPKSVVRLVFGGRFNQVIPIGFIPDTIKYIKFCYLFNHSLKPGVIPSTVTHIQFGSKWNKYLEFGYNLPNSLKTLILGSSFQGKIHGEIPQSLELIHLPWSQFNNLTIGYDNININLFTKNPNLTVYIGSELFKSSNTLTLFDNNIPPIIKNDRINKIIFAAPINDIPLSIPSNIKELVIMGEIENGINNRIPSSIEKLTFFSKEYLGFSFYKGYINESDLLPIGLKSLDLGIQIPLPNEKQLSSLSNLKYISFNPNLSFNNICNLSILPNSIESLINNNQNQFYPISNELILSKFNNLKQLNGFLINDTCSVGTNTSTNIEDYTIYNLLNENDLNCLLLNNKKLKSLTIKGEYNLEVLSKINIQSLTNLTIPLLNEDNENSFAMLFTSLPKSIIYLKLYCDLFPDSPILYQYLPNNLTNIDLILGNPWGKPMSIIEIDSISLNNIIIRTNCK